MTATLYQIDGFEHGLVATGAAGVYDATSGSPAIVTTPVRTGTRALEITASAAAENVAYTIGAGNRQVTQGIYIRFKTATGFPASDVTLAVFANANGTGNLRYVSASGKFAVGVGASANVAGGPALALDTWYRIDLEFNSSGATATLKAQVDGSTEFSQSNSQAAADITACRLGTGVADTYTAYYDDWLISVTAGDYPIGAHSVEALIPSADGTHNITTSGDFDSFTTTQFSNATTNGNTFIGHRPLQAANTANQVIRQELGTTANYMEFTLEDTSASTTPIDVKTYATHVESSTTQSALEEARLLLADNTEVLTTGSLSVIDSTEDPGTTVTIRKRMCIRPGGGWDKTKVDGLKARVGFGDNAPDANFIDFMVVVALQATQDATPTPSAVAAVAAMPAPTISLLTNVAPSVVPIAAAVPAPTITATANASVDASVVAALAAMPAPSPSGAGNVAPSTVASIAAVPAPTLVGDANVAPTGVAVVVAVPSPSIEAIENASVSPATVACLAGVPTATASTDVSVAPGVLSAPVAVPAPSIYAEGGGDANATPAAAAVIAAMPAPSPSGEANVAPSAGAAVAAVPSATVTGSANVAPNPAAITAAVPAPSVEGTEGATQVAAFQADTFQTDTFQMAASITVAPSVVAAAVVVPAPSISTTASPTVTPAVVAVLATVLGPTLRVDGGVVATVLAAVAAVPIPEPIAADVDLSAATLAVLAAIPAPAISTTLSATVSPGVVAALAAIASPSIPATAGATATPATVAISASFPPLGIPTTSGTRKDKGPPWGRAVRLGILIRR